MRLQMDQTKKADLLCQKTCNTNVSSMSTVWAEMKSLEQGRSSHGNSGGNVGMF